MKNKESWLWLVDPETQEITPHAQTLINAIIEDTVKIVEDKYEARIKKLEQSLVDMKFAMRHI